MEFEVLGDHVGDVQVDDPVHEVEAGEADGEDDARVLVDVGRRGAVQLVQILALTDQSALLVHHGRHHRRRLGARALRTEKKKHPSPTTIVSRYKYLRFPLLRSSLERHFEQRLRFFGVETHLLSS